MLALVLLALLFHVSCGFMPLFKTSIIINRSLKNVPESIKETLPRISNLLEPTNEDMKTMTLLLLNVTENLTSEPGLAMKTVSDNIGWLLSRNVPV